MVVLYFSFNFDGVVGGSEYRPLPIPPSWMSSPVTFLNFIPYSSFIFTRRVRIFFPLIVFLGRVETRERETETSFSCLPHVLPLTGGIQT